MDFEKDYSHFKAADFATDELFRAWVEGNNPQINAFWKYWLLENADKKQEIDEALYLLKSVLDAQPIISEMEVKEGIEGILTRINTVENNQATKIIDFKKYFLIGIAATLGLLVLGGFWFLNSAKPLNTEGGQSVAGTVLKKSDSNTLLEIVNNQRQTRVINLSDGSVVTLERGSRLKYPAVFQNDKREVYLEGEAFFSIAKAPEKPFLVHAQGIMTKVLGTSFRIKAFDKNVKVQVKTGKVAVFTDNKEKESESEKQAIVLTPNQQAEYQSSLNRFNKSVQEVPNLLITDVKIKDLYFDDAPVPTILNALKEAYGIDIIYDEETLHNCIITTSLTDEPLFEKLTIICKTIGATYRELDAKIIITGRGCR